MDPNGSQSITIGRGSFTYGSTWSPDGRSIAFRRRPVTDLASVPTELGLLAPDEPGNEVVLLIDSEPVHDGINRRAPDGPTWSPDGRELAFASRREADYYRIWVMARSGGQARLLLPELEDVPHFHPRWSPGDSTRLAYIAEIDGVQDLWIVDLGSGEQQRLTFGQMDKLESPRWSPDGERLAFSALPRDSLDELGSQFDIYVVDLASAELQRITRDTGTNVDPAWAPDGSSLLVSSTRDAEVAGPFRTLNLWRVWLDASRAPQRLTRASSSSTGADWYRFSDCGRSAR